MTADPDPDDLVEEVAAKLAEHFDTVRIFVTKHDGCTDETACCTFGLGNFYAQLGQAAAWVAMNKMAPRDEQTP